MLSSILWLELVLSGLWILLLFIFKEICKVIKDPSFCLSFFFFSHLGHPIFFSSISKPFSCRFSPSHPIVPIPDLFYSTSPYYRMICHLCVFSPLTIGALLIGFLYISNTCLIHTCHVASWLNRSSAIKGTSQMIVWTANMDVRGCLYDRGRAPTPLVI